MPPVWTDLDGAAALVHCPGGAAPSGFSAHYELDAGELRRYLKSSKDPATFREYLEKNI